MKKSARQAGVRFFFTKDDKKKSLEFFFFLSWKPFHKTYYSGKINTMTRTMHHNKVYNTHGPMTAAR